MSISARECKYLTDLLENEIKERQALIEKLRSDCPELAAGAPRLASDAPKADPPQPERRIGRPRGRQKTSKRPEKESYTASQHHITAILKDEGEPLTPFKIQQKLLDRFNIQVTDEALAKALKLGVTRELFCSPQQGEYALPN